MTTALNAVVRDSYCTGCSNSFRTTALGAVSYCTRCCKNLIHAAALSCRRHRFLGLNSNGGLSSSHRLLGLAVGP